MPRPRRPLLEEFLAREQAGGNLDLPLGSLDRTVLLHGHCHQKALYGLQPEENLLRAAGYTVVAPDAGCCGMAGAFGFKPRHLEA